MPALADPVVLVSAQSTLPDPPVAATRASVLHWRTGLDKLDFDLEVWGDLSATVTNLELLGAVQKPAAIVDDNVDAVTAGAETLTVTGHAYKDSDGPIQFTTSGTIPGGIALATNYWLGVVDANTVKLYRSFEDWVNEASVVDILDAGTGTHTIVDTVD